MVFGVVVEHQLKHLNVSLEQDVVEDKTTFGVSFLKIYENENGELV